MVVVLDVVVDDVEVLDGGTVVEVEARTVVVVWDVCVQAAATRAVAINTAAVRRGESIGGETTGHTAKCACNESLHTPG